MMKYFISLLSIFFITFNTLAIQIVGSDKLCQDLVILMGTNDDDLEILYNELISGQLVQSKEYVNTQSLDFSIQGARGLYIIEVLLDNTKRGIVKVLKE